MAEYITLYNKIEGTDDILEKYIPTDDYNFIKKNTIIEFMTKDIEDYANEEDYIFDSNSFPKFKTFDLNGKNTMESLWKSKFYIYQDIKIDTNDYNQKFNQLLLAKKRLYTENQLNFAFLNKYMLESREQIFVYYLLKCIIKVEFPRKYIVAGPGSFINQIIPLFIINDINQNNTKWQIIIFGYNNITRNGSNRDCSFGCIGDYVKEYIKTKINQDKIKNLDILYIDHGYPEKRTDMEISFIIMPFLESAFEKLIINDTLGGAQTINYDKVFYRIPNIYSSYVNINKIIFYNNIGGINLLYFDNHKKEWKKFKKIPKDNNCNRNYLLPEYDTKCILDSVTIDDVLNNRFSILDDEESKKGGYYEKYLKYKDKYLKLKKRHIYMTPSSNT